MSGFQFQETMSGSYQHDGESRSLSFRVTVRTNSLRGFIRDHKGDLSGYVDAEGLARHASLTGSIIINPVFGGLIRYDFNFTGDDGKPYRLVGQKDVTARDLVRSMTYLPAEITDGGGDHYAACELRFDTRDLPSMLSSFRPVF